LSRTVRGSEKPSGVFRVIALGDSTTEGFEVAQNDTYTAVLERYLKKYGVNAEVFNTRTSGFGTAEELLYLENEGIKYNPDAVVLGFFGIAAHGNPPWASSEGTAMDPREARHGGRGIGMEGYLGSLFNHGAVLVNIFGWGEGDDSNPFRKIAQGSEALAAYRKFLGGEKLGEAQVPDLLSTLPTNLRIKIQKVEGALPGWLRNHDSAQIQNNVDILGQAVGDQRYNDAERAIDAILKTIDQKY
jgi:hypothetical protein